MGHARDVAERFYERFGAGDFEGVTGTFGPGCVTVTPAGSFDAGQHEAFARAFNNAMPDGHMELIRAVEDGTIVEHEVIWDQLGMMAQLGALSR